MPSPFPGMNPYLEQPAVWHDFHQSVALAMREILVPLVSPHYIVKVEDLMFIHELSGEERRRFAEADVHLADSGATAVRTSGAATIAPTYGVMPANIDIEHHNYLEIRDRQNQQLITVIEVLSPTNKNSGPDREMYLAKRRQILTARANLVEIDLLRGGPRMPLDDLPHCDYCVLVSRPEELPRVGVWPIALEDRLPEIPIPLKDNESDVLLDLQQALHLSYDRAGYAGYIYNNPPQPRLTDEQQRWADEVLQGVGR